MHITKGYINRLISSLELEWYMDYGVITIWKQTWVHEQLRAGQNFESDNAREILEYILEQTDVFSRLEHNR
jgi:hypothetical protein